MISRGEDMVKIVDVIDGELVFTKEYLKEMKKAPGHARKFASYLATGWENKDYGKSLDYFGSDDLENDTYSGVDGEPMDIGEDQANRWELNNSLVPGLKAAWYRDILRYRLVGLSIPKRIIKEYIKAIKEQ